MKNAHEIDDGLTDEERAALEDDGGEPTSATTEPDEGLEDEGLAEQEAAAATAAAAVVAAAAEPAAVVAEAAPEAKPQPAPILIAPAPENAEAKLAEIATQKDELLNQFDEGDITAKEYQKQLDTLAKSERAIERQQDRAELAATMDQQRLQNDWTSTCNAFVESHEVYKDNPRLYKALDAEVRELASKPDTASWTGDKFLAEAHKNLKAAFGFVESGKTIAADAKAVRAPREFPPNLAKVPAADVQDTNGGRFAVLDRMASSDPVGYEETLNKMSEADRTAYLNA